MDKPRKSRGFVLLDAVWGGFLLGLAFVLFLENFAGAFRLALQEREADRAEQAAVAYLRSGAVPDEKDRGWDIRETRQAVPGHAGMVYHQVEIYGNRQQLLSKMGVYEKK